MAEEQVAPTEESHLIAKTQSAGQISRSHLQITVTALALGAFLAAFDLTVVAAIYPSIGASFNALNQTSYLATAYLLTSTAVQPLYGRLSDIYGRKTCLLFAYMVFFLGTVACSLAPDMVSLILARGLAGVGGGGLNVIGVVILSDLVPNRERGIYQGIMNIVFGTGSALGAPLGGLLADTLGWRVAFGIQLPMIAISFCMVAKFINVKPAIITDPKENRLRRVDFAGAFCLVSAVSCLILAFNIGGNLQPWLSPTPIILMALVPIFAVLFVYVEAKLAREPVMPMRIVTTRTPLLTALTNFFASAAYFLVIFNLPLFYRAVMHLSAADAGKRLIPGALGGSIGSLGVGLLVNKIGKYYWLMISCAGVLLLNTILVSTLDSRSNLAQQFLYLLPGGLGCAGLLTITLVALLASIHPDDMGAATGTSYLFRNTGSIVGLSVSNNLLNSLLASRMSFLDSKTVTAIKRDINIIWDTDLISKALRPRVVETYVDCMHDVFRLGIAFACAALMIACGIQEFVLKKKVVEDVEEEDTTRDAS